MCAISLTSLRIPMWREVHFLLLIMIICVPSKMLFICLLFFVSEWGASLVWLVILDLGTQRLLQSSGFRLGCLPRTPLEATAATGLGSFLAHSTAAVTAFRSFLLGFSDPQRIIFRSPAHPLFTCFPLKHLGHHVAHLTVMKFNQEDQLKNYRSLPPWTIEPFKERSTRGSKVFGPRVKKQYSILGFQCGSPKQADVQGAPGDWGERKKRYRTGARRAGRSRKRRERPCPQLAPTRSCLRERGAA